MEIIKHPIQTEKAVRLMESDNKLTLIVNISSNKAEIKKAVEELFSVKVIKVNTTLMSTGNKKAYVKLSKETPAIDVATKLGLM